MNTNTLFNIDYNDILNLKNFIDIFCVFLIFYGAYRILRKFNLSILLFFIVLVSIIVFFVQFFNLQAISSLFKVIAPYIFFIVVIALRFEVRTILLNLVNNSSLKYFFRNKENIPIKELLEGISGLLKTKEGAIFVFANTNSINNPLYTNGILIDANISKELIVSIFKKQSPLHDGAIMIKENKIVSAANFLPLSNAKNLKKTYGARHRAALGISEVTDSLTIFISEETNTINITYFSTLYENIDIKKVEFLLNIWNKSQRIPKSFFELQDIKKNGISNYRKIKNLLSKKHK